jgi:AcrR family transcriptional regulator
MFTAVALADEGGVESLSMRRIAQGLGVVPMALYKQVANKDEMFDDTPDDPTEIQAIIAQQTADRYPYISELASAISHDDASVVGQGCDDQFEFEFALDLTLDGLERPRGEA